MQPATSQLSGKATSSTLSRTSPSHLFCRRAISRSFCVFSLTIGNLHLARDLENPYRVVVARHADSAAAGACNTVCRRADQRSPISATNAVRITHDDARGEHPLRRAPVLNPRTQVRMRLSAG